MFFLEEDEFILDAYISLFKDKIDGSEALGWIKKCGLDKEKEETNYLGPLSISITCDVEENIYSILYRVKQAFNESPYKKIYRALKTGDIITIRFWWKKEYEKIYLLNNEDYIHLNRTIKKIV